MPMLQGETKVATNQNTTRSFRFTSLRRLLCVLGVVILGFLVYGFCIALTSTAPKQSSLAAEDPRAFFEQQAKATGDAQTTADCLQLVALDSDVEKFRAGAIRAADTKAITELREAAPGALQDFLHGKISARLPYIWPYVISGSFIVIGNALGDEPVVAFYNPYFDVAILTKWSFKDQTETKTRSGFKLMQAIPVTGRGFLENRPSLSTDQPIWTDSKALFEVRIVKAAQNFVTTFEKRYPPFGRDPVTLSADAGAMGTAISLTENRVFSLLQWVIDAQNPRAPVNYVEGINSLRDALSASSPAKLAALLPKDNPQNAEIFFRLPPEIRKGMKPYLVIDRNVIFLDPRNLPTGFISAYFPPDGAGYSLGLAAFFNLEGSYPDH